MPFNKGYGKDIVQKNISELMKSGKKKDQAIAVALDMARKSKKNS